MQDALIFAVLTTGAVLIVTQLVRLIRTGIQHKTIREAISRDHESVPQMMAAIEEKPQPAGMNDDRTGLILVALGLALAGMGQFQTDQNDMNNFVGAGFFPGLVGIALLIRYYALAIRDYLARRRGNA